MPYVEKTKKPKEFELHAKRQGEREINNYKNLRFTDQGFDQGQYSQGEKLIQYYSSKTQLTDAEIKALRENPLPKPEFAPMSRHEYEGKSSCSKSSYNKKVKNYYSRRNEARNKKHKNKDREKRRIAYNKAVFDIENRILQEQNNIIKEDQQQINIIKDVQEQKIDIIENDQQINIIKDVQEQKINIIEDDQQINIINDVQEQKNDIIEENREQEIKAEKPLNDLKEKPVEVSGEYKTVDEAYENAMKRIQKEGSDVMEKREQDESDFMDIEDIMNGDLTECEDSMFDSKEKYLTRAKAPLFALKGPDMYDPVQDQKNENCYLVSTLSGLAMTDSDYIKNELIRDEMIYSQKEQKIVPSQTHCIVKLYDKDHKVRYIRVPKTYSNFTHNWSNLVMKAALMLIGKGGYGGARYRDDKFEPSTSSLNIRDLDHGSEGLASQLFFGSRGKTIHTREMSGAKNANTQGDTAIGEILAYLKQGKIVVSSTCTHDSAAKEYNPSSDAVAFTNNNLKDMHSYLIIGEGELTKDGKRTLRIRDPYGEKGGILDITFEDYKRHFSDATIMSSKENRPENEPENED